MVRVVIGATLALLSGCASVPSLLASGKPLAPEVVAGDVEWRVLNRFRLIDGEEEEQRFYRHLSAYIDDYHDWYDREGRAGIGANTLPQDLLHQEEDDAGRVHRRNFRTHYNPQTGSHRCQIEDANPSCRHGADWLDDKSRLVRFSARILGSGDCAWKVGNDAFVAPCARATRRVVADQPTPVRVSPVSGGRELGTTVHVRDLTIVALGDSFSAGEGVPHAQWRSRGPNTPAVWLDPRCHRSLASAPSLTAAFLARSTPSLSVTLLHYGCSGASVADGVLTPWAQLEHYDRIARRYARGGFGDLEAAPWDQKPGKFGPHDVPPSQIDQAKSDLQIAETKRRADIVLLSTGGNDVGFGSLVSSVLIPALTPPDLKAAPMDDNRPVVPFDQARWVQAAKGEPCKTEGRPLGHVECLGEHVKARLNQGPESLVTQYEALAPALKPLTGETEADAKRVFISTYPNFLKRAAKAGDEAPSKDGTVFCEDRAFDGRAGMVPGIGAWFGAGLRQEAAEVAEKEIIAPLNGTIMDAAGKHGWTAVDSHRVNGMKNGYCSPRRYYNTLADSYWNQGRTYSRYERRPLGNFVVNTKDFGLPVGQKVVWDTDKARPGRPCFVTFPDPGDCLPLGDEDLLEFNREHPSPPKRFSVWFDDFGTTGPAHPNLFGHCNMAAALVSSIALSEAHKGALNSDLAARVSSAPLTAEDVCKPEAWGYESRRTEARSSPAPQLGARPSPGPPPALFEPSRPD